MQHKSHNYASRNQRDVPRYVRSTFLALNFISDRNIFRNCSEQQARARSARNGYLYITRSCNFVHPPHEGSVVITEDHLLLLLSNYRVL
jgi:hypothetical protein